MSMVALAWVRLQTNNCELKLGNSVNGVCPYHLSIVSRLAIIVCRFENGPPAEQPC